MMMNAELYFSFRSPYSYLGARRYREIGEQYDVNIAVRPVYPIAIRTPEFFKKVNPLWLPYVINDCKRIADFNGIPFTFPSPDPVVMNNQTRQISDDQPYIFRITRLGVEAARRGRGLAFIDEVSMSIWGTGTVDWHKPENLSGAAERAGLDLADMEAAIEGKDEEIDAEISSYQDALQTAGHWGVPCLVVDGEPFHGQDRIDIALWRMQQKGLKNRSA